jgi:hypothetical protein
MDKYKYKNSLVLFFAGHFFTGQWRRHALAPSSVLHHGSEREEGRGPHLRGMDGGGGSGELGSGG